MFLNSQPQTTRHFQLLVSPHFLSSGSQAFNFDTNAIYSSNSDFLLLFMSCICWLNFCCSSNLFSFLLFLLVIGDAIECARADVTVFGTCIVQVSEQGNVMRCQNATSSRDLVSENNCAHGLLLIELLPILNGSQFARQSNSEMFSDQFHRWALDVCAFFAAGEHMVAAIDIVSMSHNIVTILQETYISPINLDHETWEGVKGEGGEGGWGEVRKEIFKVSRNSPEHAS
jgi:hypothetical protein